MINSISNQPNTFSPNGLSPKEEIIAGMQFFNILSLPFRAIDKEIELSNASIQKKCQTRTLDDITCNSVALIQRHSQEARQFLAEKIQSIAEQIPESVKSSVQRLAQQILQSNRALSNTFEQEYNIPQKDTLFFLESAGYVVEGMAAAALGGALGKAANWACKESTRLVSKVQKPFWKESEKIIESKVETKTFRLQGNNIDGLLNLKIQNSQDGNLSVWVLELTSKLPNGEWAQFGASTQASGSFSSTTGLALSKIKEVAKTYNAKKVTLQWNAENNGLVELAMKTKRLEYLGEKPTFPHVASIYEWGEPKNSFKQTFPTFNFKVSPSFKESKLSILNPSPTPNISSLPKTGSLIGLSTVAASRNLSPQLSPQQEVPSWIDVDAAAQKLVDVVGDITGAAPLIDQGKAIKEVLITAFSSPENAPKLLVKQFIAEPEKMYQKIIDAPEKFLQDSKTFLNDPTLAGGLGILMTAVSLVSVANDILPILTKVSADVFKNPLNAPITLSKELLNLTTQKIIGVYKLVEGLVTDPLKTIDGTLKGIIRSPKELVRNVKDLFGHGRRKAKRAKRRAKKQMQKALAVQKKFAEEIEKEKAQVLKILPTCFCLARQQWMISENLEPQDYLSNVIDDWKAAVSQGKYKGNCIGFIQMIYSKLKEGFFTEVYHLSPLAHASSPTPPLEFLNAISEYTKNNSQVAKHLKQLDEKCIKLGSEIDLLEHAAEVDRQNTEALKQDRERAALTSAQLENQINTLSHLNQTLITDTPRLANLLASRISPEEKARLQNALNNNT